MQPLDLIHAGTVTHLATTGIPGDLGRAPDGGGWQGTPGASPFVPYWILYGAGARPEGTLANLHAFGHAVVQISTFAATSSGAGATAATLRAVMPSLTIPGVPISSVAHILSRGPQPDTDLGEQTAVFTVIDQFDIWTA